MSEYNNQSSPSIFVKTGVIESVPVPVVTNVTATYGWNYDNRLTSIASPTLSASFVYDQDGTRVKSVFGTTTTRYPTSSYSITSTTPTKHIAFPDGELVATVEGTGASVSVQYVHTDHLGSTSIVTSESGSTLELIDYNPYGTERLNWSSSTSGNAKSQKTYIGEYSDRESGLAYLNARYYDPTHGQFLSQDPVFWEIGQSKDGKNILLNPQAQNSSSYGFNNPIKNKDPNGRCPDGCIIEAIVLFAVMYAPQISSFGQSLLTPLGQYGLVEAGNDAQKGNYGLAVVGAVTAGEMSGGSKAIGTISKNSERGSGVRS